MNEQQPYQKQIVDKLQEVPLPDMEASWQQMNALLDEEDKKRAVAFSLKKGKKLRRWIGILLVLFFAGVWLLARFITGNEEKSSLPGPASITQSETKKPGIKLIPENPESRPGINSSDALGNHKNTARQKSNTDSLGTVNQKIEPPTKNTPNAAIDKSEDQKASSDLLVLSKTNRNRQIHKAKTITRNQLQNSLTAEHFNSLAKKRIKGNQLPGPVIVSAYPADITDSALSPAALFGGSLHQLRATAFTADSLTSKYAGSEKKKQSNKNNKSRELIFSAGLSLSQSFAIGGQQAFSYNSNAKRNLLSDYIPAVFAQYHFSKKFYTQGLVQFNTPQYSRPLLIYENKVATDTPGLYNKYLTYIRKLYYFNIPLTVYFSPAKNLWIGAGLQYSNLQSTLIEEQQRKEFTGMFDTLFSSSVSKLKDNHDSLALFYPRKKQEWRGLAEINYYWNRWTLGLSYNQAFSDFIDIKPPGASGATRDKNKSFQIYLRYSIWELRRKKNAAHLPNVFSR